MDFFRNSYTIFLIILGISAVHGGHTPAASGIETIHPEHIREDARFSEPGLKKATEGDYDYDRTLSPVLLCWNQEVEILQVLP